MLVPFFILKQLVTRSDVPPIPQKVTFGTSARLKCLLDYYQLFAGGGSLFARRLL